ncbi:hypothetical protein J2Z60_001858 [Lactobacillus colini]|uniref:Surface layer protein A domain-containing protein n=1 Tax=Lactobacillus colini TaxID=1819254 RepID=A0ABS4MG65_9LACO|nr:YSIRK-type signal peptide-containing protein [Lactobacillus colini]MBP2058670.1 hypothetical protein [Lactobacillus colini]
MKKEEKKLRFSIRKFAIGAASVAIGATLLGVAGQGQVVHAADNTATVSSSNTPSQGSLKINNMSVNMSDAEFAKINDVGFFNSGTNAQIVIDFAKQVQSDNPGYEVSADAIDGEVIVKKDNTTVQTIKVAEYLTNSTSSLTNVKFVTPNTSEDLHIPVKVKSLTSLTDDEFNQVQSLIKSLNSNVESVTQSGTKVIIKFSDGSTKNLSNKALVNEGWISTFNRTGSLNTSATTVSLPDKKVVVKDAKNLTDSEKAQVIESLDNANSGLSDRATIKVSDNGYVRVIFNTNQGGFVWLQPSDIISTDATIKVNGTVKVKKNTRLYTSTGKLTKTTVKKNSKWKTTSKIVINSKTYYQIDAKKKWIPASRVTFTATKKATTSKKSKATYPAYSATVVLNNNVKKVSLYDYKLKKVTATLSNVSYIYTTNVKKVNGKIVAYRYKSNQWIKAEDVASVAKGHHKPAASSKNSTSSKTSKSTTKKSSSTKAPKMTATNQTWKIGWPTSKAYLMDASGKKVKNIAYGKTVKAVAVGTINGKRAWKLSDGNYIYAMFLVPVK